MKYYRHNSKGALTKVTLVTADLFFHGKYGYGIAETIPTEAEEITKEHYRLKLDDALESNITRAHKAFTNAQRYQTATLKRFDSLAYPPIP